MKRVSFDTLHDAVTNFAHRLNMNTYFGCLEDSDVISVIYTKDSHVRYTLLLFGDLFCVKQNDECIATMRQALPKTNDEIAVWAVAIVDEFSSK